MTSAMPQRFPLRLRQRGAVLFVSLIILLVLSLFAITTANTALMEQKMAGATRNMQLARLAADSALNDAKVRIAQLAASYGALSVCAHLRCFVRTSDSPYDAAALMQTEQAKAAMNSFRLDLTTLEGADESARLAASPGYVIEDLGVPAGSTNPLPSAEAGSNRLFRITALGFGGRRDYEHAIESVYTVAQ